MKVLVVGGGGREHALVWKISESPLVDKIFCAPGNAGTAEVAENVPIKAGDIPALKRFARENKIDLTVVGPEDPLVNGITDEFEAADLPIIGPRKNAAYLEGSKVDAYLFMRRHNIPVPVSIVFDDIDFARRNIGRSDVFPKVLKADGLAAGKGVIICKSGEEITAALDRFAAGEFGSATDRFLWQVFRRGEEASFIVLVDKQGNVLPLVTTQDHKAVFDGDKGPNTGGMGAYSPAPVMTEKLKRRVMSRIVYPTIRGMAQEGTPSFGVLYFGLMIDVQGNPWVIEYNVRLGDPETQPILARMRSDIVELFLAMNQGNLDKARIIWDSRKAVCVVKAAKGYPGAYPKGHEIFGIEDARRLGIIVDQAGTARKNGKIITAGGRVLAVTALGRTFEDAIGKAYAGAGLISMGPEHFRQDIAQRAINR